MTTTTIDETKLRSIISQAVSDFGGTVTAALVTIGDRLGLYKALREMGSATHEELATSTGSSERYLRHWLLNQAASGYIDYSPETGKYSLSPEQALVFADDESPAAMAGGFGLMTSVVKDEAKIAEAMMTGTGMLWSDHDPDLFLGSARFFKPSYVANIVQNWIPALTDIQDTMEQGATAADIGCGYGISTIIMAKAYPKSRFFGFDNHPESIEYARQAAREAGVADRITFEVAAAQEFPGRVYDLLTYFDCFHDMGDPEGAADHARHVLSLGGSVLLVEPMAGDTVEENLNPFGRLFSAASVLICTPHAIAEGGKALGAIATDAELKAIFDRAGFGTFRRATETLTNRVFEAKP
ncbi:MAG TPA: class I SAM-dependent methyltransferase [Dehalococcoidia bacterium]|nr:class I SAM-dependent methyltransferase [Dehalococcoidia bacterium]